jgi:hypothetical protein
VHSCKASEEERKAGFENNAPAERLWLERKRLHEQVIDMWRATEAHLDGLAQHSPSEYMMLCFDDTSPVALPHFGNREYKTLAGKVQHLEFVPWLVEDVGRRMQYYVYSLKDAAFQKGANRWSCLVVVFLLADPDRRD